MKNLSIRRMKRPLLSLLICLPGTLWAQNILDKTGNPTSTPVVAFSVRQLSSAYTGPAMQVRKSSNGRTKDIPFTPAGDLDTALLKSFVGADTGYITIWYDQSGNGLNAVQPKATAQPAIMAGGLINRDNGQPSVYTNGINGYLYYQPVTQLTSQVTRMEVCRNRGANLVIIEGLGYYQLDLELFPDHIWVQYQNGNITVNSTTVTTTMNLMSINSVRNSSASQLYVNTIFQGSDSTPLVSLATPDTGFIGIRWDDSQDNPGGGAFSETMLFDVVLSDADRQSINYNENWYYSLGFDPCSSTRAALSPNGMTDKALYACMQDASYAYYYDPSNPLNLLFGIAKDPGNTGANPSFLVDSTNLTVNSEPSTAAYVYSATSGMEGIFALGRYWNVFTHTPPASPVNVRFFYKPSDTIAALKAAQAFKASSGASSISNLQWFKTVGGPFTQDSLTATPKATIKGPFINLTPIYGTTSNGVNYVEFDGITSFSGGTGVYLVSNSMTVLPVVITSFTGRRANETTVLSWATQSESNTDHFDIERSIDGITWTKAGQVTAADNNSVPLSYQYIDAVSMQPDSRLYYRLKLVSKDGQYTYSNVVLVEINDNTVVVAQTLKIAPNPVGSVLQVICTIPNNGPVEVQLQDMAGATLIRQKYTVNKGANILKLTGLNGLARGIYLVRVLQGGAVGVGKVIK